MKVCVLLYHKNATILFKPQWIQKCITSIQKQTFNNFDVLELNYGQTTLQLYQNSIYENIMIRNHVEAMNYLIQKAKKLKYDYIFNTNIDDYYSHDRFEIQLEYLKDYDMVSCDYNVIKEKNNNDIVLNEYENSKLNIKQFLEENKNIIPHPGVAWNTSFFNELTYKDEIPEEDLRLWQRAIKIKTIFIIPKKLLYYRIHDNQITQLTTQNNKTIMEDTIIDFTNCFEKSIKTFLSWTDLKRIFESWWKKFHFEKQLPNDYELRKIIDKIIGDPIRHRGWFIKIRKDYEW